ncbi:MAG: RimK family alpha-L-glutamate ligase [Acidobacteria bacterium]|uniref:RimK family alpha-L-glutamate ligase n=1 Tax=Candidatus Sulfomarinibacter kjeldsenii TaxID=2885994 RepID=A0A8J7CF28_9BACT|nr:RimK family alpha-L-glutamate ligase [Candidatus Sulfomarinibacter kjeldsenii]MBD3871157.1 RimK family alpha-L-glutamate ligase [Candidatus Sulfomarinibacter kjeldsenii]
MRLLLLSARPDLRTNTRFAEAANDLGIDLGLVDGITASASLIDGNLKPLGVEIDRELPDAVLARVGNWRPESLLAVLEAFVACGVATPNPPAAIRMGRDHWATTMALTVAGLPVPPTLAGADPEALAAETVRSLGLPAVVKQRRSRMGVGVIRCATRDHLEAILDSLWRIGDEIVVQRWLAGGEHSLRLMVVGGSVVAAARFSAAKGEWRSNSARGGSAEAHDASPDEKRLAVAAAAALGLGHCGVDLVGSEAGPVILEINPTPGFLRLEEATGIDVARALVEHAVAR